jgi:hypothetical protein
MTSSVSATATEADLRTELGRFFAVAAQYTAQSGERAMMPACPVDTAWHEMLGDDAMFGDLVTEFLGPDATVRHLEANGRGVIGWTGLYERSYGPLPQVWFTSPQGVLDEKAYADYQRTGIARLSWDCTPG